MLSIVYVISRFICFILVKILFRTKVFYRYRIPREGALIIASNHASFLDPVVLGVVAPRKINFMAKDELFSNIFFGLLLRSLGVVAVRREGVSAGAFKEAFKRLKAGQALAVFPEGTRAAEGSFGKAHPGVGFLAIKSKATVIPAYIKGSANALPRYACFVRLKPIRVYFGKPLNPDIFSDTNEGYRKFANLIMEGIATLKVESLKKI